MNQAQALKILKSGANVFLTGEPGSGKTYVINQYVAYLNSHGIKPAVTASTGIAATHIGGMTIHSWSGIGIKNRLSGHDLRNIATNGYVKKRVLAAKVLIIDEISMLPPETLQMIDAICREVKQSSQPFGGLQVVLVGDFFQLPPVVRSRGDDFSQETLFGDEVPARFAYDSPVWEAAEFTTCYVTEQHRQDDNDLVSILSRIRGNRFDDISLDFIQKRKFSLESVPSNVPKLFSHNIDVDSVNDRMLAKIPGEAEHFPMIAKGHEALIGVMKKGCLSPENLFLKVGAAVMFTKNNPKEGYVNGTLGIVEAFDDKDDLPIIKTRDGHAIKASYSEWVVEEEGKIKGRISQLPLRLAWAITVHKSQGISLDEAVIDLSKVFEFGQGYVAISRVKRLSGIYILGWNDMAFQVDPEILEKDKEFSIYSASAERLFSQIPESDQAKLENEFIIKCDGEIDIADVVLDKKKVKVSTHDETFKLWNDGLNLAQIAETRSLSEKTVLSHVEDLVKGEKIKAEELSRIIPPNLIKALPEIEAAFKELKTSKLTPIFKYFKSKFSYDELKLARMATGYASRTDM